MTRELRNPEVRLSEDVVPAHIFAIIAGFVLIVLGGIAWAWGAYQSTTTRFGGLPVPEVLRAAPRTISGVAQTPILLDREGQRLRERQRRHLESFGWVDRAAGVVHIPIDDAIDRVVEEGR